MEPKVKSRRRFDGPPAKSNKKALWWMIGGTAAVAGGLLLYFQLALSPSATKNRLDIVDPPKHAPRGDAVPVVYGLKPGDIFETSYLSDTHFITVADEHVDLMQGMQFKVAFVVAHSVTKRDDGPGLSSRLELFV